MKAANMTRVLAALVAGATMGLYGPVGEAGSTIALENETPSARCLAAWNDAPADDVCTETNVLGELELNDVVQCEVLGINCSITATDSDGNTLTWTPAFSVRGESVSGTEALDVCFSADGSGSSAYSTSMKSGCDSGEITSAEMDGSTLE